ncbi:hypothetical protein AAFF_G00169320 [Aldrovandia affinis]|uniref:ribonuclease H n=1 Tax=Aldrovandia affinis TaxID=143900 RepID=A0AAD7RLP8_9TELE|nr:hypothetical protein AAFF_G00169320 [Aldrovandia affinis]
MHPREAVYSGLSSLLSEEDQYLRLLADPRPHPAHLLCAHRQTRGRAPHRHQGAPVYARARRRRPAKLAVAKAEFAHMEQRLMDSVLRVLPFVYVYLDDILIASATEEEHLSHLRALFTRLSQHGLIVNPAKCLFGRAPSNSLDTASPRSLREFIGMVTFYHRFIPRAAHTLRPLYEALKGKSPNQAIEWTAEREGPLKTPRLRWPRQPCWPTLAYGAHRHHH